MNKLEYRFKCLEGFYELMAEYDDEKVIYEINTDIPELSSKSGEKETREFSLLLDKAGIERWDGKYEADASAIEDASKWAVDLLKDEKEYHSKGVEGFWPYGYEYFIEALKCVDDLADYMNTDGGNR